MSAVVTMQVRALICGRCHRFSETSPPSLSTPFHGNNQNPDIPTALPSGLATPPPTGVLVRYAVQAQWVRSQSSFLSAKDPRLHFGLGTAAKVSVELHWPQADLKVS